MKTKVLFLSVFALSVLLSNQIFAQQEMHNHNSHDCFVKDLSDEQKTKIDAIKLDSEKKIAVYKADVEIKEAELKKLELAEDPSIKDINEKIDEIYVLKADIKKEKVSKRYAIRNELTPEQQAEFDMHRMKKNDGHKSQKGTYKSKMGNNKSHMGNMKTDKKHLNPDCKEK